MAENIFNTVRMPKVDSNSFDLSYDLKLSLDMGQLVPIHVQDVFPGDHLHIETESMLRMAPMIAPVMHKVDVYTHFFFVPNRILWSGWEDFITGVSNAPAAPYFDGGDVEPCSLADYMGLPLGGVQRVNCLPFAAYQKIYNEYYRDQNLIQPVSDSLVDGENTSFASFNAIRNRAWEHDYFTSSLPNAQADTAVDIPLGDVKLKDNWQAEYGAPNFVYTDGSTPNGSIGQLGGNITNENSVSPLAYDPVDTLETTPTTINELREAFALQAFLEKTMRGGKRMIETIWAHFGVKSSDARLNRPEYLGGSMSPMIISEVLQTAPATTVIDTPQGNMAGHGISVGGNRTVNYHVEEHGFIIGIMSIRPKPAYQQGMPRMFTKFDRLEYPWPSFAHLGEQEVLRKEIYYEDGDPSNENVWGYVPRYAEYRFLPSRVAGDFRTTLSFWHLGRIFADAPVLNQSFIDCVPSRRIFAVEDPADNAIYAHVFHRIKARRKLPKYGTPR